MKQTIVGIVFILFGLFIGGVGIASAGIGIGIPMIPFGIYLIAKGIGSFYKKQVNSSIYLKYTHFEKVLLGLLLIIIGFSTSLLIIGIPIIAVGVYLIWRIYKIYCG
jgi:hypothetical protein